MKFYYTKHTKTQLSQLLERIGKAIYEPIGDLEITAWQTREPVTFAHRRSGEKLILKVGDKWGDLFDCAWFLFRGEVPKSVAGKNVVLMIDLSGEALVVDSDGNPAQCLTTVSSIFDRRLGLPAKTIVSFKDSAVGGEKVELWADAGNNDLFGNLQNNGAVQQACIAICNSEMRALYYDYEVLHELLHQLPEDSARYQQILYALYKAAARLNSFTAEEAIAARAELAPELAKENGDYSLNVSAIGHSHLDLAWLWPIRETIRKGARTFSNVLKLMEYYSEFVFGASQAQLYQWMKDRYPSLYSRVKKQIAEGRWESLAATWVEPDTNIIGGEAFVRQFLYGKRFSQEEFGANIQVLFLPDSFGYTGALPQLMKKCGIDYFLTTKLSWDRFSTYPHQSFFWQGIDGSKVMVHMPPEGTYNSSASPRAIQSAEAAYLDKAVSENCLLVYGIGDGGGGPGEEHLERLLREKNLAGMAPVTQESVASFFKKLEKNQDAFQTWVGELYLGVHQGTYTTQGRNKRYNRKLEIALRELEFNAVLANLVARKKYPQEKIETIWKELLLYQFHDILPGSSIKRVYEETLERYEIMSAETRELIDAARSAFQAKIDTTRINQPILVINSLSWQRKAWVKIHGNWHYVDVPAMGYATLEAKDNESHFPAIIATSDRLENDLLRIKFDHDGNISSIVDKENQREVISSEAIANQLTVYYDDGDAWDFSVDYNYRVAGQFKLQSREVIIDGPQAKLKQVRHFGKSKLIQQIVLTAGSRRIDFETRVEWNESQKMLRASFPVSVQATESVSEIQFGHIRRSNNQNTSWEQAKFEICAHKWIDLSQADFGVALLNDCKYGHKVIGNVLDINLIRSPLSPDQTADQAMHEFTYSLFPHIGNHISGGVIQAGYELNIPLEIISLDKRKGTLPSQFSFITIDAENVILESIKQAEDSEDVILRFYEAYGMTKKARLKFGFDIDSAFLTDLLERDLSEIKIDSNLLILDFKPFEIHTIRLKIKK